MRRREIITILGGVVACPFAAFGQVSSGRPLVAVLLGGSATNAVFLSSFLRGMQEIGYVEGRDIDIVTRYAEGDLTRAPALAADLIRQNPAVFVTGYYGATRAIMEATAAIPIVNPTIVDPIGFGLVQSQARPGGQITGILVSLDTLLANSWNCCSKLYLAPRGLGR